MRTMLYGKDGERRTRVSMGQVYKTSEKRWHQAIGFIIYVKGDGKDEDDIGRREAGS